MKPLPGPCFKVSFLFSRFPFVVVFSCLSQDRRLRTQLIDELLREVVHLRDAESRYYLEVLRAESPKKSQEMPSKVRTPPFPFVDGLNCIHFCILGAKVSLLTLYMPWGGHQLTIITTSTQEQRAPSRNEHTRPKRKANATARVPRELAASGYGDAEMQVKDFNDVKAHRQEEQDKAEERRRKRQDRVNRQAVEEVGKTIKVQSSSGRKSQRSTQTEKSSSLEAAPSRKSLSTVQDILSA